MSFFGLLLSSAAHAISPQIYGEKLKGDGTVQTVASPSRTGWKPRVSGSSASISSRTTAVIGVIVATDPEMLKHIGETGEQTIVGASIRVGVKTDDTVSYRNPDYWYRAHFRKNSPVVEKTAENNRGRLAKAPGKGAGFAKMNPPSRSPITAP